ncbi:hypothetical protein P692DRAFT_20883555 [Suillus brevipes Sb2]|nr:hypothetical protein P692DRAFT_20883555 [Suillus brevipes Sb2]
MATSNSLDLTEGLLGREVPKTSGKVYWKDGHTSILPAVFDQFAINVCNSVDIPIVNYLAEFPSSTPASNHVLHLTNDDLGSDEILDRVESALGNNRPVVIRGEEHQPVAGEFTPDYLDKHFGISPNRAVYIHDVQARAADHVNVTKPGTIASFFASIMDPRKIQCVLDLPLAHTTLPQSLKHLDHGLVYGWNETLYDVPATSNVHPENFTVKGWGLLHHAGYLTYPHHDAEGTLTWVRMEFGLKFWTVFRLKSQYDDRIHIQEVVCRLGNFTEHEAWAREHCDAEVITLTRGDILIMPPGLPHAVYTPVKTFATGGHAYNFRCLHLSELARYIDATTGDCTTNQKLEHALETLRRMLIAVPRLSPRIRLFKRPLLSLCIMATQGQQYRAKGGSKHGVTDRETAKPSADVAAAIFKHLGVSKRIPASTILYEGNQFVTGDEISRDHLASVLKRFTVL